MGFMENADRIIELSHVGNESCGGNAHDVIGVVSYRSTVEDAYFWEPGKLLPAPRSDLKFKPTPTFMRLLSIIGLPGHQSLRSLDCMSRHHVP